MRNRSRSLPAAAVSAAACAAFAACSSAPEVSLQDHGVILPTLRFDYSTAQAESPTDHRGRNSGIGGELTGGGGSFAGGAGDYDLFSVQGWMYLATPHTEHLRAGALLGLELLHVGVSQTGAARNAADGFSLGPLVGFDVGYEFVEQLEVYTHATATGMLPPASSLRGELGLRWRPAPAVELFGGYRWWRLQRQSVSWIDGDSDADLDLHTDGLVVGMGLVF